MKPVYYMRQFYRLLSLSICRMACQHSFAQTLVKGMIIDAVTKEPLNGAAIHCTGAGCDCGCTTNAAGTFEMKCTGCERLSISCAGYTSIETGAGVYASPIALQPSS